MYFQIICWMVFAIFKVWFWNILIFICPSTSPNPAAWGRASFTISENWSTTSCLWSSCLFCPAAEMLLPLLLYSWDNLPQLLWHPGVGLWLTTKNVLLHMLYIFVLLKSCIVLCFFISLVTTCSKMFWMWLAEIKRRVLSHHEYRESEKN